MKLRKFKLKMARQLQFKRMRKSKSKVGSRPKSIVRKSNFSTRGNNPGRLTQFRGYGFPDTLRTNLVYSQSISLVPSAVSPCPSYGFRLTSLYDPDYTGVGGQPYWFDQLMAVYGRFKVLGAKMTVVFSYSNEIIAGVGPALVGVACGEQSSLNSTDAGVLRMTNNSASDILTTQSEPKTVTVTYSPRQAFGGELTDALTGTATSNPSRNWQAFVFATPQGVDVTKPMNAFVTIEYFAEFTQQSTNAGS